MKIDKEYRFPVSISKETFIDKTIAKAMIGDATPEYKAIRKQYGLKSIHFYRKEVNSEELLNYLLDGHCICHLFGNSGKYDYFYKDDKKIKNFQGAYCICVDIDETKYTLEEYIEKIPKKPTFYYTSYRHMKENEEGVVSARFRMVYVFNTIIKNHYVFRYICKLLNDMIENNVETIKDKCNLISTQYFNGTYRTFDPIFHNEGIIYNFEDFGINLPSLTDYMIHYCEYKSPNKEHQENIKTILYKLTGKTYVFNNPTMSFILAPENISCDQVNTITHDNEKVPRWLVKEFKNKGLSGYNEIMRYHWKDYKIFYRTESDIWIDDEHQFIDENYICLPFYRVNLKDGQKRRKHILSRACVRRVIKPTVNAGELFINACWDVIKFMDNSDHVITIDCILANVEKAMSLTIEEIFQMYGEYIDKLKKDNTPKDHIIFKYGTEDTPTKRKNIRYERINEVYDFEKTDKENQPTVSEHLGYNISIETLKRYRKEYGKTKYNKSVNTNYLSKIEETESVNTNYLSKTESVNTNYLVEEKKERKETESVNTNYLVEEKKERDIIKNDSEITQKKKRSKQEELNELKRSLTLDGITKDYLGIHNYTKDIDVRMINRNNQDSFESMFI